MDCLRDRPVYEFSDSSAADVNYLACGFLAINHVALCSIDAFKESKWALLKTYDIDLYAIIYAVD